MKKEKYRSWLKEQEGTWVLFPLGGGGAFLLIWALAVRVSAATLAAADLFAVSIVCGSASFKDYLCLVEKKTAEREKGKKCSQKAWTAWIINSPRKDEYSLSVASNNKHVLLFPSQLYTKDHYYRTFCVVWFIRLQLYQSIPRGFKTIYMIKGFLPTAAKKKKEGECYSKWLLCHGNGLVLRKKKKNP